MQQLQLQRKLGHTEKLNKPAYSKKTKNLGLQTQKTVKYCHPKKKKLTIGQDVTKRKLTIGFYVGALKNMGLEKG